MRNTFMLYMPPGYMEAMVHNEETIRQKVAPECIYSVLSRDVARKLQLYFQPRPIAGWGGA